MDADAQRRKRMEEIEEKRKRLEQMRKARGNAEVPEVAPAAVKPTATSSSPTKPQTTAREPITVDPPQSLPHAQPSPVSPPNPPEKASKPRVFTISKCAKIIDILPAEVITYEKGCQTEEEDKTFLRDQAQLLPDPSGDNIYEKRISRRLPNNMLKSTCSWHSDIQVSSSIPSNAKDSGHKIVSEEEKSRVIASDTFKEFLNSTSLFVERALEQNERSDILKNYSVDKRKGDQRLGSNLLDVDATYEEDATKGRAVIDVVHSTLQTELFLVSYGSKIVSSHRNCFTLSGSYTASDDNSPGMVCVWNTTLRSRPEFRFSAGSVVIAAIFHISEPHIVIGGCYNGQIVVWDMRTSRDLPVSRSSVTGKGHKHPVFALSMLRSSTTNTILPNNELLSLSVDGMLCQWDVSQISEPVNIVNILQQTIPKAPSNAMSMLASPQLETASTFSSTMLNTSSMAISYGEGQGVQIIIGSGSGHLVSTAFPINQSGGMKMVEGHYGLITSLCSHPSSASKFRHLVLSCSVDWSVRLWHLHHLNRPLMLFPNFASDYVVAVRWCPINPAVFASICSGGQLFLWNIVKSCTEHQDSINLLHRSEDSTKSGASKSAQGSTSILQKISSTAHLGSGAVASALCSLAWVSNGQELLVGDSSGVVHCVGVHASALTFTPHDESKLDSILISAIESLKD